MRGTALALLLLATACRSTVASLDLKELETEKEIALELEGGRKYSFWEDIDYELQGPHQDEGRCFEYRIEALQSGQRVEALKCAAFLLNGPCLGGKSRGPGGEGGDCQVGNCTLVLPKGGNTTIRAGVHQAASGTTTCVNRFHRRPEFKRLTLKLAKSASF